MTIEQSGEKCILGENTCMKMKRSESMGEVEWGAESPRGFVAVQASVVYPLRVGGVGASAYGF